MAKLDGKVAIVTGGARGLGRAYARRLAGLGAKVAVLDRDLAGYQEFQSESQTMDAPGTVAEIEAAGGEALGLEVDLTDPAATNAAIAKVLEAWRRIDILVANAGGGLAMDMTASTIDPETLEIVTARNLYSTVYCVTAVAPIMKHQRSGKIVTTASTAALTTTENGTVAHYGAAKAAIAHYTKYLAQDLGPFGITVNCIAPGVTATGRISDTLLANDAHREQTIKSIPLRRIGTVEDCARVIEFLTTDLSDYVSGVVIPVDGGSVTH